jgi:hypothetical protein
MLSVLASLVLSTCDSKSGIEIRYEHTSSCAIVSDCLFSKLTPEARAVILSSGGALTVLTSTFYQCNATGDAFAGAIAKLGSGLFKVDLCCIHECSSITKGFAINSASFDGMSINFTTFWRCGYSAYSGGKGTIHQETPMFSTYSHINISYSRLNPSGDTIAGFVAAWDTANTQNNDDGRFDFSFSGFYGCRGQFLFVDQQKHNHNARSHVQYCNFAINDMTKGAILYSDHMGMKVTNCRFTAGAGIGIDYLCGLKNAAQDDAHKYEFGGCVFPSFPSANLYIESGTNWQVTGTATFVLTYFNTALCFGNTPYATSSRSRTPTRSLTRSPSRSPSPIPTRSRCAEEHRGVTTHIEVKSQEACIIVSDSFFAGIWKTNGAGILVTAPGNVIVMTSTFYNCTSNHDTNAGYGGAIAKTGAGLIEITQSCFRECRSWYRGMAINIGPAPGLPPSAHSADISDTNFAMCSEMGTNSGEGTLHHENGLFANYQGLNFSGNSVSGGGSAFHANSASTQTSYGGTWSFKFCTFLSCSGRAIIWSDTPATDATMPSLTSCNFYDNKIVDSGAVLYGVKQGMSVTSCNFGQSTPVEARIVFGTYSTSENTLKFRFTNCVFAYALSDTSFWTEMSGNSVNANAASLVLTHFNTGLCPTSTPTATRSQSPTPTQSHTPTPTLPRSPSPTKADCQDIRTQQTTRIDNPGLCVIIRNSYFSGLSAPSGGAIQLTFDGGDLRVETSIFFECRTGDADGYGGAITKTGSGSMQVDECCFRKCESSQYGLAINLGTGNFEISSHEAFIARTHFEFCTEIEGENGHGTIHHENGLFGRYEDLRVGNECKAYFRFLGCEVDF